MVIQNKRTGKNPLFAHAQGRTSDTPEWQSVIGLNPLIDKNTFPEDVTIVTFMSGDMQFCLAEQLEKSGIPFINAVPKSIGYWKNTMKIKYMVDICEGANDGVTEGVNDAVNDTAIEGVKTKYILCLDAIDILGVEDMSELMQRFLSFDADIVYNASKQNYPPICRDIEDTDRSFRYLNAGAFIGKTDSIKKFYQYIINHELYRKYEGYDNSEQVRVRFARLSYPDRQRIKVDTECEIFQTLNKAEFIFSDNTLIIEK